MRTAEPQVFMLWIKEIQVAKSIDELDTSRSITGQHNFPDFDVLDAMIASTLKRLLDNHIHFHTRVSVEEQRAQKTRPILTRDTNCLHDPRAFPYNRSS